MFAMSLLHLKENASDAHDASAEGKDLASGSSYILGAALIAFVVMTVGVAVFMFVNKKPPPAAGEVTQVWAHAVHTLNTPMDANGIQSKGELFDQVLVFAQVRVRNQSDDPIVIKEMMTNVTLDDGGHSSYVATATDYDRIFIAYPELAGLHSTTLARETVIGGGQTVDGMIVSAFHVTKAQWAARKDLSFTIQFKLHPDLVLLPKGEIIEQ